MASIENELGEFYGKISTRLKKKKLRSFFLYIFFLFYFSIPSFQVPILEYNCFRVTSLMEQRAFENFLLFYPKQTWINIGSVSPNLLRGIIAMEDGSFFKHKGIDWKELDKSMRVNKRRGRSIRGGSTVTMQLSKNLFLSTSKTSLRKAKEFLIAFRMEKELTKKAILQNYINAVEWGESIFGIKVAAKEFFNKEPGNLSSIECARLAAVLPSPLKHKPNLNSNYVLRRSSIIRNRMGDIILFPEKNNAKK